MPQNDTGHDVFISYSHFDRSVVDALSVFLEKRNIRCWFAPRNIPPGEEYADAIVQAIEDAKFFVLVFSDCSQQSEWVKDEIDLARGGQKIIISFRIEDCPLKGGMKLYLKRFQWVDAFPKPGEVLNESAAAELADTIIRNLAEMPPASAEQSGRETGGNDLPVSPPQPAPPRNSSKRDGEACSCLRRQQPTSADRHIGDGLSGSDLVSLLKFRPELADCCNWEKLSGSDLVSLLKFNPELADCCNWEKLSASDLVSLLKFRPELADCCNWEKLSGSDLVSLLKFRPELADCCNWEKLSGSDLVSLLKFNPELADRCNWEKLSASDLVSLLKFRPELADRRDLNK